jgi:hypothetical protein
MLESYKEMKRWFRYWAEYPFAHTITKEEDFFFMDDIKNSLVKEDVREWAESTPDGQAISGLVGRSIRFGFERVDELPPEIKERKLEQCRNMIERQVQVMRSLKEM